MLAHLDGVLQVPDALAAEVTVVVIVEYYEFDDNIS